MARQLAAVLLCLAFLPQGAEARAEPLPRPAALDHQVRFWTRVYSEVDTNGGLIHDARRLDVVYEVVRFPAGLSRRSRERRVEKAKKKYVTALRRLAGGKRSKLSRTEAHVLALWPPGVSNKTLRGAARLVRFQLGQADKFREGLIRSGRWEPHIREVFAEHGIPPEIAALPHVESSFNPHAYSSAGAAGLWQFTRSTGRRYLRIDYEVDERFDPFRSSEAAAQLLLDNYRKTRDWPLAVTAYNHGATGVRRAIRRVGTRDIATIVEQYRSRSFGFASRNFYTELLAAIEVERDAERYFGPLELERPVDYDVVALDHYYRVSSLVDVFGTDAKRLREHNLSLRLPVWREQKYAPRGYALRIPRDPVRPAAAMLLARIPPELRFAAQKRDTTYRVRRGDTLSVIARRFGVRMSELVAINGLRSRHRIRVGQTLRLPTKDAPIAVARFDGTYSVRRGDTIASIARRLGVRERDLVGANGLRDRNRIQVGQRLRVPGHELRVAAAPKPAPPQPLADSPAPGAPDANADEGEPTPPAGIVAGGKAKAEAAEPTAAEPLAVAALHLEGAAAAVTGGPDPAPSQVDPAPSQVGAAPESSAPAGPGATASEPLPAELPAAGHRYAVASDGSASVEPGETLGHYADWLGIPTAHLRRLNRMRLSRPLVIGQAVELDFSKATREAFEQRRLDFHMAVQREFFEAFRVAGTRVHVLRRGDTVWGLSRRHQTVPLWLLQHYNPELDFSALHAGEHIQIPRLERRPG